MIYEIGSFKISEPGGDGDIILPPHPLVYGFWQAPTRICVEALEQENLKDKIVLDIGTGSGILAVVAVKLGAKKVYATDTDPIAIQVARNTFKLNNLPNIDLKQESYCSATGDICIANIGAEFVQDNYHKIKAHRILSVSREGDLVILNV